MLSKALSIAAISALALLAPLAPTSSAQPETEGVQAGAEGFPINLDLTPDQTFSYRFVVDVKVRQQQQGVAALDQAVRYEMDAKFTVLTASETGAELTMSVERANFTVGQGDQSLSIIAPAPDDIPDWMIPVSAALDATVVRVTLDAAGTVTKVAGLDPFMQSILMLESPDQRLMGFMPPSQLIDILTPVFTAEGAQGTAPTVGETWTSTKAVQLPPVAVLDFTYNWSLSAVTGKNDTRRAIIAGEPTLELRRPVEPNPSRPTLAIDDHSSSVMTQWNLTQGLLDQRVATQLMETTWGYGPDNARLTLTQQQSSSTTITRLNDDNEPIIN